MTLEASLNDSVPAAYRGLDRSRRQGQESSPILRRSGLIERIEPHKLTVPRGDRSNAVLEPLLTDQWFVDIKPLAAPAIRAVEEGTGALRARQLDRRVFRMDAQNQGLVHQPATVVGPSHTGVVRPRRPMVCGAQRGASPRPARHRRRDALAPGQRRAGYLVLLGAVAIFHAGVAGEDARAANLLPDHGAGDGIRHHLLLGGPHDHDGPEIHRRRAVSRRLYTRADSRPRRPENVQDQGQRHRSLGHRRWHLARGAARQAHLRADAAANARRHRAGYPPAVSAGHRSLRHRCAAPVLRAARDAEPRSSLRHGARRGVPEFLQQIVERGALRADECRRPGSAGAGSRIQPGGSLDSVTPRGDADPHRIRIRRLPPRQCRQCAVRVHLARILRLVSGTVQGGAAVGHRPPPPRSAARASL